MGDRAWCDLLERHHALVGRELTRFRGRQVDAAGDGILVTFDGPARGVRCALAVRDAVQQIGLEVPPASTPGNANASARRSPGYRCTSARVSAHAAPGEVLVSSTVKDLVAGSGLRFVERGTHVLNGVTGDWQLFAAE
jgi:class 3 adenylate cyclase